MGSLTGTDNPNDEDDGIVSDDLGTGHGIEVCAFDNRGMGRSSVPTHKSEYTTTIMAKDSITLLDHLGWERAHIIGHSMETKSFDLALDILWIGHASSNGPASFFLVSSSFFLASVLIIMSNDSLQITIGS